MKFLFTSSIFTVFTIVSAQAQTPDIKGMWSTSDQKKPKVFTINSDEVVCHISDVNNRYASSVRNFKTVEIRQTDMKNGRIIARHDSENVSVFYAIDYFNLNTDSVRVAEISKRFNDVEAAKNCPQENIAKAQVFYTTEYMGKLSRIRKTPAMTKETYTAFLRDVSKELQKPESKKNIKPQPGVPTDLQAKEFMMTMLSKKQYQGKIIPETLEVAIEKFKDEATVKKIMPMIRNSFVVKPTAPKP